MTAGCRLEAVRGPAFVVVSAILYAVGNIFSKTLYTRHMSQVSVFLFRAVLTYFINAGIAEAREPRSGTSVLLLRTQSYRTSLLAFVRGCAGFGQVMLLNLSFDLSVSVADAFAIKEALGTLMTVLVARAFFGADERLSTRECIGVLAVLLGLLLIVQPPAFFPAHVSLVQAPMTATLPRWVGFIMLSVGAAFQCVQNLLTRVLSRTGSEHAVSGATLLSFYMVAMGVLSISVALFVRPSRASGVPRHWAKLTVPNSAVDSALLAGVVLAGTAGQLAVAAGARTTSASKVALLAINELAFAYVFSVTVLGEPTSFLSAVGTVIVFFSSALVAAGNELDCCPHSWYGALAPL